MRLCTFRAGGPDRIGAWTDRGIVDLLAVDPELPDSLAGLLAGGPPALERAARAAATAGPAYRTARDEVTLLPPIPAPGKIICIGLNYRDHAAEVKLELPTSVAVFAKWPNVLIADGAPIVIPAASSKVDYEAELAFVIGTRAHHVAEADAFSVIGGYTCFNDVSVRDYQARTSQWTMGKVWDTHGPCGPVLVTRDELPDPGNLRIRCSIDGETLQDSSTSQMVFSVPRLVAELSAVMTLEPGDIVSTGTPAGVGVSRNPRRWIRPGERVRVEIEGIGALENPAVAEGSA
ncbi:MAG: fumarylacetoacetate hydrolase family protein [Vulcanimicrobiaceae bacterium]|jgi:2-keto-4-pentenoate hydratase/2-oxohepta-3-ene-1,7-dioic acid hydratase in catechol pathway